MKTNTAYLRLLFCARMENQSTMAWTSVLRKKNRQSSSAPAACKHTHGCLFHGNISTHPGPSNADRSMTSRLVMRSPHCWLSKTVATFIVASYPNLQPNSNDTAVVLPAQILQQLAAFANGTPSTLTLPVISRTNALD